ncbi:alginate O-acetyltransferase AlgF [Noviherbaspirillum malthae]|uniref:alginate O-acetyltransferase AlgF n=1 Tax=Noviherbaspirillum malthae TaxID=1260987 RepID=UPI00188F9A42|nr:alginate O-acetyltransferase AlgF [Noviherbaspirillum malthae]
MPGHSSRRRRVTAALMMIATAGLPLASAAQSTGLLYDPQPPADSAYVRIIALGTAPMEVAVDGARRIKALAASEPSEYLVLPAGPHQFELRGGGRTRHATVNVQSGRALTLAFITAQADAAPVVFEDRPNANKLKAVVAVYHLHAKSGALDVSTADGSTRVFANVGFATSSAIPVNPITVDLIASAAGDKARLTGARLAMAPGGTYSVFLVPDAKGNLELRTRTNQIERFTGAHHSSSQP